MTTLRRFAVVALVAAVGACTRPIVEPPPPPGTHAGFYAAPTGSSSAEGSGADPWDLSTALHGGHGAIQPGDTVWLRGGTYLAPISSNLAGSAGLPIIVQGYPGERPIIDGKDLATGSQIEILTVDGSYTIYRDFEITNTATDRVNGRHAGVYLRNGTNVKLVNLIIHDTGMGVYAEQQTSGCEIYGLIIYNNGWETAVRSNGHGMYLKQSASGQKFIRNNIMFNSFGLGIHVYTDAGTGALRNLTFEDNVVFNSGTLSTFPSANVLIGGEEVADGITFQDNTTYFSPGVASTNVRVGYLNVVNGAVIFSRNYVIGGVPTFETGFWTSLTAQNDTLFGSARVVRVREADLTGYSWSGNRYFRDTTASAWQYNGTDYTLGSWRTATGMGGSDVGLGTTPALARVSVQPNAYEPGRATIVVDNWGGAVSVPVNVSGVLANGDLYEVRNVLTWFGSPAASGTYSGGSITIPLAAVTPTAPIGGSPVAPLTPGPAFNVFVVRRLPHPLI